MMATPSAASIAAKYDLTNKISQYLDRHLVAPLLEFLAAQNIYEPKEVIQSKLELLSETNMMDYVIDVFKKSRPDETVPERFLEKRSKVVEEYKNVQEKSKPITDILNSSELPEQISNSRDYRQLVEYLMKNHEEFKLEMIDSIYDSAKLYYECGDYGSASQYLNFHNELVPTTDKNYLAGLWGKLACNILLHQWDYGVEDFEKLKNFIDEDPFRNSLQTLQQRTWLLHWGLYLYFNHSKGWDILLDLLSNNAKYLNVIQTTCPHILRYWATAVIISKHSRHSNAMKELIQVIQQESYTYKDPITEFIECLHVNFDFDGAQKKLKECEQVLYNDFFLVNCYPYFMENARLMIFETFCRIHQCISIGYCRFCISGLDPRNPKKVLGDVDVPLINTVNIELKLDLNLSTNICVKCYKKCVRYKLLIEEGLKVKQNLLRIKNELLAYQANFESLHNDDDHQDKKRTLDADRSVQKEPRSKQSNIVINGYGKRYKIAAIQSKSEQELQTKNDVPTPTQKPEAESQIEEAKQLSTVRKCGYLRKDDKRTLAEGRTPIQKIAKTSKNKKIKEKLMYSHSSLFSNSQITLLNGAKYVRWDIKDIVKAYTLRILGNKAYKLVRSVWKIPLPSLTTLKAWGNSVDFQEGILESVLKLMEGRGHLMEHHEKICVLNYDAMNIEKVAEYDLKNDRTLGPFKEAQVCLVRGIYKNWKQPVFYDFDKNMTKDLLFEIIRKLKIIDYDVKVIVSDLGGSNITVHNQLGVKIEDEYSFVFPEFSEFTESTENLPISRIYKSSTIYIMADMPHMIKLIRNHIIDEGLKLENGAVINRAVFEEMILFDNGELKLHPGLNTTILDVKGSQRMRVGPAYALFSEKSVQLAKFALTKSNVRSEENVRSICDFLQIMSDLIKVFESYVPFDQTDKLKSGFGNHLLQQKLVLDKGLEMIKSARFYLYSKKKKQLCLRESLLPCQKGIICSIRSLNALYSEALTWNSKYILTHRLNQNALESFFSKIRALSGQNVNPTALGFKDRLKLLILGSELQVPTGANVEEVDSSEYFLTENILYHNKEVFKPKFEIVSEQEIEDILGRINLNDGVSDVRLDETRTSHDHSLRYVAGYLSYKFKDKNYGVPTKYLESAGNDSSESEIGFIEFISRGNLMIPSDYLLTLVKLCDKVFETSYDELKYRTGLVRSLTQVVINQGYNNDIDAIQLFFKVRIKAKLKVINKTNYINKKVKEKQFVKIKKF